MRHTILLILLLIFTKKSYAISYVADCTRFVNSIGAVKMLSAMPKTISFYDLDVEGPVIKINNTLLRIPIDTNNLNLSFAEVKNDWIDFKVEQGSLRYSNSSYAVMDLQNLMKATNEDLAHMPYLSNKDKRAIRAYYEKSFIDYKKYIKSVLTQKNKSVDCSLESSGRVIPNVVEMLRMTEKYHVYSQVISRENQVLNLWLNFKNYSMFIVVSADNDQLYWGANYYVGSSMYTVLLKTIGRKNIVKGKELFFNDVVIDYLKEKGFLDQLNKWVHEN